MRHRVLFFSDVSYFKGGAEYSLFDLLSNPSVEPLLAVPEEGELGAAAERRGIPVVALDLGAVETIRRPFRIVRGLGVFRDAIRAALRLKALARETGAVCVHTNGLKADGIACIARLFGGPRVVAHLRAIPFTSTEKVFWWFMRAMASRLILVSRPCWPGVKLPANARVVHNGITPPRDQLQPYTPAKPLRIGFVGRLQHIKHVDLAIDWLEKARQAGIEATLTIRGEAESDEQGYVDMLHHLVREKGLEPFCRFEGKVSGGLDEIYRDLDVNVVPSMTADPLPRSVMESVAVGVPVIGYPAGGIPDMIIDGQTGFLARNAEEFVTALRRLTRNADEFNSIRQNGLAHIIREFSLDRLHRQIAEEYRSIEGD